MYLRPNAMEWQREIEREREKRENLVDHIAVYAKNEMFIHTKKTGIILRDTFQLEIVFSI